MNRVRELRIEQGLTQQMLSADIEVSQQYISKVENGTSSLTEDVILRLSKYFHVSIAYLLGVTDDRHSEIINENEDLDMKNWIEVYHKLDQKNQKTVVALAKYFIDEQQEKE
jgi:transcriptional regulator with XRE-family HTH domain